MGLLVRCAIPFVDTLQSLNIMVHVERSFYKGRASTTFFASFENDSLMKYSFHIEIHFWQFLVLQCCCAGIITIQF